MKNSRNIILNIFPVSRKNFMDSTFDCGMKRSSARLPNFLIIPNTIACPSAIPSIASRVPPNHPNAYPAAISNGSPGIIAAKT